MKKWKAIDPNTAWGWIAGYRKNIGLNRPIVAAKLPLDR